jgi:hypothetical protein
LFVQHHHNLSPMPPKRNCCWRCQCFSGSLDCPDRTKGFQVLSISISIIVCKVGSSLFFLPFFTLSLSIQVIIHILSLFSNYLARPLTRANSAQMTLKRRMAISRQILHVDPLLYSKNCLLKCAAARPIVYFKF